MAKPLPIVLKAPEISNESDVREDLRRKLADAPIEHAAALLSVYELAQKLHDSGTLEILRGLFGASDDIIGRIASLMNSPEAIRSIRNIIALAQVAGSVDPKIFESLRDAVTEAVEKNKENNGKPPRLWSIIKRADSEDSLWALSTVTDFMESFGKRLKPQAPDNGSR